MRLTGQSALITGAFAAAHATNPSTGAINDIATDRAEAAAADLTCMAVLLARRRPTASSPGPTPSTAANG